ncbi:hypothetical protein EYF80_026425 [Liparis tanakae]|uniref:Uncharacterized protein n=1 Tax=Liparis tanakae TaxID=230148 RepID=A0A4Z2HEA6_9TELE|nr:hypothetical protein EYF80_026425 [Liparis tanakae]
MGSPLVFSQQSALELIGFASPPPLGSDAAALASILVTLCTKDRDERGNPGTQRKDDNPTLKLLLSVY